MRRLIMVFAKDGEDLFRGQEGSSRGGSAPIAPVAIGSEYFIEIEDIALEGDSIAQVKRFVIFVSDTKVGDSARIQIDEVMGRFDAGPI